MARCLKRLGWKKKQVRITLKIQGESVSKPRWFYVREPRELELSQDATAAAKAEAQKGQQCNQSDAEVIDLRQAAERSRASK